MIVVLKLNSIFFFIIDKLDLFGIMIFLFGNLFIIVVCSIGDFENLLIIKIVFVLVIFDYCKIM